MSDLARRRERSKDEGSTTYCFCDSCDRVLYVDKEALYCPVCSSRVMEVSPREEISLRETSDTPAN